MKKFITAVLVAIAIGVTVALIVCGNQQVTASTETELKTKEVRSDAEDLVGGAETATKKGTPTQFNTTGKIAGL